MPKTTTTKKKTPARKTARKSVRETASRTSGAARAAHPVAALSVRMGNSAATVATREHEADSMFLGMESVETYALNAHIARSPNSGTSLMCRLCGAYTKLKPIACLPTRRVCSKVRGVTIECMLAGYHVHLSCDSCGFAWTQSPTRTRTAQTVSP